MTSAVALAPPVSGARLTGGDVYAVVVNFRTPDLTLNALAHLYGSANLPGALHVYVVDNGSGDDSAARIAQLYPDTPLIRSPTNLGFAGGNNLALRAIL